MHAINATLLNILLFSLIFFLFVLFNNNPLSSILATRSQPSAVDEADENAAATSTKSKSRPRKSRKTSENGNYFVGYHFHSIDILSVFSSISLCVSLSPCTHSIGFTVSDASIFCALSFFLQKVLMSTTVMMILTMLRVQVRIRCDRVR